MIREYKKLHGSGTTTLIISNEALEDSDVSLKGITKTIKNEKKEQKGGFLSILLGTLASSLLENMLSDKGVVRAGYENKQREGVIRAGYGSSIKKSSNSTTSSNKF